VRCGKRLAIASSTCLPFSASSSRNCARGKPGTSFRPRRAGLRLRQRVDRSAGIPAQLPPNGASDVIENRTGAVRIVISGAWRLLDMQEVTGSSPVSPSSATCEAAESYEIGRPDSLRRRMAKSAERAPRHCHEPIAKTSHLPPPNRARQIRRVRHHPRPVHRPNQGLLARALRIAGEPPGVLAPHRRVDGVRGQTARQPCH